MNNISETLMAFWRRPLDIEGDAVNWILFLGFVIIVSFMWSRVLKTVID